MWKFSFDHSNKWHLNRYSHRTVVLNWKHISVFVLYNPGEHLSKALTPSSGVQGRGGPDGVLWRSYTRGPAHRAGPGVRKPVPGEEVLLHHPLRPGRAAGSAVRFPRPWLLCLSGSRRICWRFDPSWTPVGGFWGGSQLTGNPVRASHVSLNRFVIAS